MGVSVSTTHSGGPGPPLPGGGRRTRTTGMRAASAAGSDDPCIRRIMRRTCGHAHVVRLLLAVPAAAIALAIAAPAQAATPRLQPFRSCAALIDSVRHAKHVANASQVAHFLTTYRGNTGRAAIDGHTLYSLDGEDLRTADLSQDPPRTLGRVHVPGLRRDGAVVVTGGRALVLADTGNAVTIDTNAQVLSEIDVSDPAAPHVLRTLTVNAGTIGIERDGSVVRVVLQHNVFGARNQRRGVRRLLPDVVFTDRRTGTVKHALLAPCTRILHPSTPEGSTLTILLTIDEAHGGLARAGRVGYLGAVAFDGSVFSPDATYLPDANHRVVHRFASDGRYAGSFALHGDYAGLSEHAGVLHVVTAGAHDMFVTNVAVNGLTELGTVAAGVGGRNELFSQSFDGDMVYVIGRGRHDSTLGIVDAGTGAAPRALGHAPLAGADHNGSTTPLGDGLLLVTPPRGDTLELYDVRDPAAPALLGTHVLPPATFAHTFAGAAVVVLPDDHAVRIVRADRAAPLGDYMTVSPPSAPIVLADGANLLTVAGDQVIRTPLPDSTKVQGPSPIAATP